MDFIFFFKRLLNSKGLVYFGSFDILIFTIDHIDRINTFVEFL